MTRPDGPADVHEDAAPRFERCLCTGYRHGRVVFPLTDPFLFDALANCGDYCLGEQMVQARLVQAGDLVLDIGANIGLMTLQLARLAGPGGRVLAFEPCPYTFGLLAENLRLNGLANTEPHRAVVSSAAGVSQFLDPDLSRIVTMDFGRFSVSDRLGQRPGRMVETRMLAVDDLALERCDFIKIDVEGHETAVVEGALGTIRRLRPAVSVEAWNPDDDLGWIDMLRPLGYRVFLVAARVFSWPNFKSHDIACLSDTVTVQAFCLPERADPGRVLRGVRFDEFAEREALRDRLSKFRRNPAP